jgi:hypothetical protein
MIKRAFLAACLICSAVSAVGTASTGADTPAVAAAEETQTCPACGYENKAGLNYCIKCGASLREEAAGEKITCPQCGTLNAEGAKFCTNCGYRFGAEKEAAGAPTAGSPKMGVYFTGGLASYGSTELKSDLQTGREDMGLSWAIGGGFALPVWSKAGKVRPSLELSTDVGFSTIDKEFGKQLAGDGFKTSLIPIRETVIFGIGLGSGKTVKPFCGFGGGVAILGWEYTHVPWELALDEGTTVKPVFDVPFGCEFRLTPHFGLGVKADYLIIPGDIEMEWAYEWYRVQAKTSVPNVFLFGGTARLDF